MNKLQKKWGKMKFSAIVSLSVLLLAVCATVVFGADETEYVPALYASIWALIPPVVAIGLALVTKEVYSSLFVGILVGAVLYG